MRTPNLASKLLFRFNQDSAFLQKGLNTLLGLFLFSSLALANSFFDVAYETLDETALRASWSGGDSASLDRLRAGLFLAEREELVGHRANAEAIQAELATLCRMLPPATLPAPPESVRLASTCLVIFLRTPEKWLVWEEIDRLQTLQRLRNTANSEADTAERAFVDGQFYFWLPPSQGQNLGRALLSYQILRRLRPEVTSSFFWLGRTYETQGNRERANEYYQQGIQAPTPDVRTSLMMATAVTASQRQERVDGVKGGFSATLGYVPARGAVGQIALRDDRLFGSSRSGDLRVVGGTRRYAEVQGQLSDSELFNHVDLALRGSFRLAAEDFYGLGSDSAESSRADIPVQRFQAALSATRWFAGEWFLQAGWQLSGYYPDGSYPISLGVVDSGEKFTLSGPFGEFGLDSRDSRVAPRSGSRFSLGGFFPSHGIGADRTYQKYFLVGEHYRRFVGKHVWLVSTKGWVAEGSVPFGAYSRPRAGELPGFRDGRFADRQLLSFHTGLTFSVFNSLELTPFVTTVTASEQVGGLFQSSWQLASGMAFQWFPSRQRGKFVRLEVSRGADQWNVIAGAGSDL